MKRIEYISSVLVLLFIVLINGCTKYPAIQEPDMDRFNQTVHSLALQDSLAIGKLTPGMPYFVVRQLFKGWTSGIKDTMIPVASLGSKQRLEESEGLGRAYVDPDIKVFLDKYETEKGKLYVWYQRPDFYTMDVSRKDTLCVFLEDTVICSVIENLNNSAVLTIRDSLPQFSSNTNIYAEVRYKNHPWREVSFWYDLKIFSNGRTFKIKAPNFEIYPVEFLKFNGKQVSSFNWR